ATRPERTTAIDAVPAAGLPSTGPCPTTSWRRHELSPVPAGERRPRQILSGLRGAGWRDRDPGWVLRGHSGRERPAETLPGREFGTAGGDGRDPPGDFAVAHRHPARI